MNLVQALRITADRVEDNPQSYDWTETSQCNCGQLAQVLLGLSQEELDKQLESDRAVSGGLWCNISQNTCSTTGLPISKVVQSLISHGLTVKDIVELEDLANSDIRDYAGLPSFESGDDYDIPEVAARYMRAWADLLEVKEKVNV